MEARKNPKQTLQAVDAEIAKRTFAEFVKQAWPIVEGARPLAWSWHIDALCLHIQALAEGRLPTRKVAFNVPPRSTKSTIVTIMAPCWLWVNNPYLQFMFASYSFSLSRDHAYKRRAILESSWYKENWPQVSLAGDRNNIMEVANTQCGLMYTTSVGGSTTGRGADWLISDDPNDALQMESDAERQTVLNWVDLSWSTRANDANTVRELLVQQRTHVDDVTGHVLNQKGWTHVRIPMEFDPDNPSSTTIWKDPRTRKGELIDPKRFPKSYLDEQRVRLGPYGYAGQYDQLPTPAGGGLIQRAWIGHYTMADNGWFVTPAPELYRVHPRNLVRFCTVDQATTVKTVAKDDPDYTVIGAWCGIATPRGVYLFLIDLIRERLLGPDIIPKIRAMHEFWNFAVIGMEAVGGFKAMFQSAQRERWTDSTGRMWTLPVREISQSEDAIYRLDTDKVSRVMSATALMANLRFFVPTYAPWLGDYISELIQFPNASHDDQVDITTFAIKIVESLRLMPGDLGEDKPIPTSEHDLPPNDDDRKPDSAFDAIRPPQTPGRSDSGGSPWDALRGGG